MLFVMLLSCEYVCGWMRRRRDGKGTTEEKLYKQFNCCLGFYFGWKGGMQVTNNKNEQQWDLKGSLLKLTVSYQLWRRHHRITIDWKIELIGNYVNLYLNFE